MVSQLMQLEAAPQTRLKAKVTAEQSALNALQSVNTKLAAVETAAEAMRAGSTTWQSAKATSTDSAIAVSAAAGAAAGTLTFDVTRLARNQVSTITATDPTTVITTGGPVSIKIGSAPAVDITVGGTGSVKDVADAVNAAGIGVKAALVTNSNNETVLQLTSTKTGTANAFTITAGVDPASVKTAVSAQDAEIAVGDPANGGYTVTSDTNSFSNLMQGVTITAGKVQAGVTVSVASDSGAIADKMQAFVDAANAALAELKKQGDISVGARKQAALAGDFTLRQMTSEILSASGNGLAGYGSFKQVGVELNRDGTLKFDKDAFLAAYAADPAKAQTGAAALGDALKKVTGDAQKDITSLTQNHNTMINNLNDQIDSWDVRLATRQAALQRQYSNLEVALGKLQSQSTWLSGQIAGLSTGSS
jgi:flagellar hook-associated protein 2